MLIIALQGSKIGPAGLEKGEKLNENTTKPTTSFSFHDLFFSELHLKNPVILNPFPNWFITLDA